MKLVTHSNTFHYDEVLATALLLRLYPDAEVIRTRDNDLISEGDIVYDVGHVFDPKKKRFDHHMSTFTENFSKKYSVLLSSSGLIYKYFHEEIFKQANFTKDIFIYDFIVDKIYEEFFLPADAIDNGVEIFGEIKPRTLPDLVRSFNYKGDAQGDEYAKAQYELFMKAVEIVGIDWDNYSSKIFGCYIPKYCEFYEKIQKNSGPIFVYDQFVDMDLILDIDLSLKKDLKYVVSKSGDTYRIHCLRVAKKSFESRVPLLESWRGKRGEDLAKISNIPSATFVHKSGFTGGADRLEDAIRMCEITLENYKPAVL